MMPDLHEYRLAGAQTENRVINYVIGKIRQFIQKWGVFWGEAGSRKTGINKKGKAFPLV